MKKIKTDLENAVSNCTGGMDRRRSAVHPQEQNHSRAAQTVGLKIFSLTILSHFLSLGCLPG
jgi:hypothetical protein